jgi:hypothetical protein
MTDRPKFEEIDVERINVREPDGTLRMTISNNARSADPELEGTPLDRTGSRGAGLLFFNDNGTECGGLSYGGHAREDASAGFFFDRFGGDQTVGIQYIEGPDGRYGSAFFVQDRPVVDKQAVIDRIASAPPEQHEAILHEELGPAPMRAAMGRNQDGSSGIYLLDSKGNARIVLTVDASDTPHILLLDAEGNVTYSLPPEDH